MNEFRLAGHYKEQETLDTIMTDRVNTITVVLEKDVRIDDCEATLNAIRNIRGVLSAEPGIADIESHMAEERAKRELGEKIWRVMFPRSSDA